jgi:alkylation response protein AidB-like acyl-CoA dehydrogenase
MNQREMDMTITEPDERAEFQNALRHFFGRTWSADKLRAADLADPSFDAEQTQKLAELSCTGLLIPETYGGAGGSWQDEATLYHAFGRALFPSPHLASSVISAQLILRSIQRRPDAALAEILSAIAGGTGLCSYVLPNQLQPIGERSADALTVAYSSATSTVSGKASGVLSGDACDWFLIWAVSDDRQPKLVAVQRRAAATASRARMMMSPPRTSDVTFEGAPVVAELDADELDIEEVLRRARLLVAAEMIGGAERALEMAQEYSAERTAFGHRIGSFQALQHKMADVALAIQVGQVALDYALTLADDDALGVPPAVTAVTAARNASALAVSTGVQIFGGSGVLEDVPISLYYRHHITLDTLFGMQELSDRQLARSLVLGHGSHDGSRDGYTELSGSHPFKDDPIESADLRAELRNFFETLITPEIRTQINMSNGDYSEQLYQSVAEAGYIGLAIPREFGGRGLSYTALALFEEEGMLAGMPHGVMSLLSGTAHFAASLILRLGTDEQKRTLLPSIMNGEDKYSQGFTEPGCGSDLAAVQCSAVRDGDHYIVSGQKVFNSGHIATHLTCVVRTDKNVRPYDGISLLLIELADPSVQILPMYTMRGWRRNVVIFDQTRVPATNLIGSENRGWYHLMHSMDLERSGMRLPAERWRVFIDILDAVRSTATPESVDLMAGRVSQLYFDTLAGWLLSWRVVTQQERGEDASDVASYQKLFNGDATGRFAANGIAVCGRPALIEDVEDDVSTVREVERGGLAALYKDCKIWQIAGGSSEIQKNIIARRILNLPKD